MITSNLARRGHPSRIFIPFSSSACEGTGLRTDSVIMTDNFATILQQAIAEKIGHLSNLAPVDDALRVTFGL